MSIDIKNYIIEKIKELNPNIDTRMGSVFRDFMINPFSSLLAEYQKDHDDIVKQQAVTDLITTSTSALDAVGANFLVSRNEGTIASGFIKIYFAEPQALNIPTGTVLTTNQGLRFKTIAPFNISRFQMEQNLTDFPNYDSGNILLQAQEPGINYNVALGTIFSFGDAADTTPVRITAATVFTGGTIGESNATFFSRLRDTVHNKTLASPAAIESTIKDNYTDVVNVAVVGAGHPLMIRDLTNYTNDIGGYISEDFIYVYSGLHTGTYDKGHIAMTDHFIDSDKTAAVSVPMITG